MIRYFKVTKIIIRWARLRFMVELIILDEAKQRFLPINFKYLMDYFLDDEPHLKEYCLIFLQRVK